MRELGVWDQRRYPGFSEEPAAAFHDLAHDLGLARDFLSGPAAVLRTAAAREASDTAEQNERAMVGYVGDHSSGEKQHVGLPIKPRRVGISARSYRIHLLAHAKEGRWSISIHLNDVKELR
jgi:hypothetical protein